MSTLNIVMAQINPLVGDIDGNKELVLASTIRAMEQFEANIVVFPELTLTGYPPEDLLLRPSLQKRIDTALNDLLQAKLDCYIVVGYPKRDAGGLFNMAGVIYRGELICEYAKHCLPNYQVFDEKRYFTPGFELPTFMINGNRIGLSICEDIWEGATLQQLKQAKLDLLLNLNGSPFHQNKQAIREALVQKRTSEIGAPIIYVNQVGGQDELVFDGGSMAWNAPTKNNESDGKSAQLVSRSPLFEEHLNPVIFDGISKSLKAYALSSKTAIVDTEGTLATIYKALVLGVKDYVNKNGFKGVVLGLSGGIDSALTLAVAS